MFSMVVTCELTQRTLSASPKVRRWEPPALGVSGAGSLRRWESPALGVSGAGSLSAVCSLGIRRSLVRF